MKEEIIDNLKKLSKNKNLTDYLEIISAEEDFKKTKYIPEEVEKLKDKSQAHKIVYKYIQDYKTPVKGYIK